MAEVAVVTGSSGGIGAAVSSALSADGYSVIGIDHEPGTFTTEIGNIGDESFVAGLPESDIGPVVAVVHCAAHQPTLSILELQPQDWLETFAVNVVSLQMIAQRYETQLLQNKGTIVAITSIHASQTSEMMAAYAASKAALESWIRSAAIELGPSVATMSLALGAIDTPKLRQGLLRWDETEREARLQNLVYRTPAGRLGSAYEVAQWVRYLLLPEARFASGSTIKIDGGVSSRLGSE